MDDVHFQSGNTAWETPQELFDDLNDIFQFETDVCASEDNTKCVKYFSEEDDAFQQEWTGTCWVNPPYGQGISKWVNKAYRSSIENGATVVCLLPARTDTRWFETVWKAPFIIFVKGRLKFQGASNSAPFPSCIAVFGKNLPNDLDISMLAGIGTITRAMWSFSKIDQMRYDWMRTRREERESNGGNN